MATQSGAEDEKPEITTEEAKKVLETARKNASDSRLLAMVEVTDEYRAGRDKEIAGQGHTAQEEAAPLEPEEKPATRRLKVNGQEVDVELDKIIEAGTRTLQKESAADMRLEEATRILNEAKAQAKNFENTQPSQRAAEAIQPSNDAEQYAQAIIDGDKDAVTKALQKILGATSPQGMADGKSAVTEQDVYRMVNGVMETNKAMSLFKSDPSEGGFGDLFNDPILQQLVMDKEESLSKLTPGVPATERLKQAASDVRAWRDTFATKKTEISGFDEVTKQKSSMATTPVSAGSRSAQKAAEAISPEAQQESIVEKMAKARGQRING